MYLKRLNEHCFIFYFQEVLGSKGYNTLYNKGR